jgi:hypothetical protein
MVATFQTPWRRTQTKQTLNLKPKTLNQVLNRIVDVSSAQATSTLTISSASLGVLLTFYYVYHQSATSGDSQYNLSRGSPKVDDRRYK